MRQAGLNVARRMWLWQASWLVLVRVSGTEDVLQLFMVRDAGAPFSMTAPYIYPAHFWPPGTPQTFNIWFRNPRQIAKSLIREMCGGAYGMSLLPWKPFGGMYLIIGELLRVLRHLSSTYGLTPWNNHCWHVSLGNAHRDLGVPLRPSDAQKTRATPPGGCARDMQHIRP